MDIKGANYDPLSGLKDMMAEMRGAMGAMRSAMTRMERAMEMEAGSEPDEIKEPEPADGKQSVDDSDDLITEALEREMELVDCS